MIVVSVTRTEGAITGFTVTGHSRYRPSGEDVVCAAVSMLVQTSLLGLHKYLGSALSYKVDDEGIIKCSLPEISDETDRIRAEAILETMLAGLKNLQITYSQYIRVFKRRWTSC